MMRGYSSDLAMASTFSVRRSTSVRHRSCNRRPFIRGPQVTKPQATQRNDDPFMLGCPWKLQGWSQDPPGSVWSADTFRKKRKGQKKLVSPYWFFKFVGCGSPTSRHHLIICSWLFLISLCYSNIIPFKSRPHIVLHSFCLDFRWNPHLFMASSHVLHGQVLHQNPHGFACVSCFLMPKSLDFWSKIQPKHQPHRGDRFARPRRPGTPGTPEAPTLSRCVPPSGRPPR